MAALPGTEQALLPPSWSQSANRGMTLEKLSEKIFPVILSYLRDEADVALIWAMHAGIIQANYLGQG